jgi:hypothetical protein
VQDTHSKFGQALCFMPRLRQDTEDLDRLLFEPYISQQFRFCHAMQIEAQYYKCVVHNQPLRKSGNRRGLASPKVNDHRDATFLDH